MKKDIIIALAVGLAGAILFILIVSFLPDLFAN
jgi:capsular polysaccharide biosynthesis protein